jgi:hypothetical protein
VGRSRCLERGQTGSSVTTAKGFSSAGGGRGVRLRSVANKAAPSKDVKVTVYVERSLAKKLRESARAARLPQGELVERALEVFLGSSGHKRVAERGPGQALALARKLERAGAILEDIAGQLNRAGFRTSHGLAWSRYSAHRLLRLGAKPRA